MSLPPRLILSQSSLQDYADCPRRFELRYVLGVAWPSAHGEARAAWERRARLGAAFHLLIQQHLLGIAPQRLAASAEERGIAEWWEAYQASPPRDLPPVWRTELSLSVPLAGYRLAARYDVVATDPGRRAVIVDWKTTASRPGRAELAARLQTQVYLYVLAEASAELNDGRRLAEEQVELVYWFANHPQRPERFTYDARAHARAGERLQAMVTEIGAVKAGEWPTAANAGHCRFCRYQTLCDREQALEWDGVEAETDAEPGLPDPDLEQIAEIEF
jgi:CRISPR/Cas system-associated exonuclease Cas4 (RecB family)